MSRFLTVLAIGALVASAWRAVIGAERLSAPRPAPVIPALDGGPMQRVEEPDQGRTESPIILAAPVASVGGWATWYSDGPGLYAAAGPALRRAIGAAWRGTTVSVCELQAGGSAGCVRVRLSDWCACGDRQGTATVIDLSADAFSRLAPLSRGVIAVQVDIAVGGPIPTVPATDTIP